MRCVPPLEVHFSGSTIATDHFQACAGLGKKANHKKKEEENQIRFYVSFISGKRTSIFNSVSWQTATRLQST